MHLRIKMPLLQKFCGALLSNFSSMQWSPEVTLLALNALRIFTREQEGISDLISPKGLSPLIRMAGLDKDYQGIREFFTSEGIADNVVAGMFACLLVLGIFNGL